MIKSTSGYVMAIVIIFQRPEQFPIMPKAERGTSEPATDVKSKMISLETLQDALPDFGKEQEVS